MIIEVFIRNYGTLTILEDSQHKQLLRGAMSGPQVR